MCSLSIFNRKIEMLQGPTAFLFVIIILISAEETDETKNELEFLDDR